MKNEKIEFTNKKGEKLSARLELPADRRPYNYAIFAHCFTCNKNFIAVRYIAAALAARGFGVLSFDFTGLGMSEGDFSETNFSGTVDDLISAAEFLETNYAAPTVLIGHSLGGAATLLAASVLGSVKAVVTVGAPAAPQHVTSLLENGIGEIEANGASLINIGGRIFTIKKQFVEDLEKHDLLSVVHSMKKAFLFLHSPQDKIVGIENAAELFGSARHPKSFVSLDGADHLLSNQSDANYVGDLIASWVARYAAPVPKSKELDTDRQIVAFLGNGEKFTTFIKAGEHLLTADEPESFGGNDFGASPYQLVASGLAACTAMTLRLYADRKKWDLREVYVHIKHEKTHLEDCLNCDAATSKIDHFTREIEIIGELGNEQKQRLLEIADKCPVHRTLENTAHISTKLKS